MAELAGQVLLDHMTGSSTEDPLGEMVELEDCVKFRMTPNELVFKGIVGGMFRMITFGFIRRVWFIKINGVDDNLKQKLKLAFTCNDNSMHLKKVLTVLSENGYEVYNAKRRKAYRHFSSVSFELWVKKPNEAIPEEKEIKDKNSCSIM